jgi:ferredoxin-NADP reductase
MLHNNASRPAVFLAGGIGITPFRSLVRWAAQQHLPHRIFLFDSNRRPEGAPFLDELRGLAKENANFLFVPTMTQMARSKQPWNGTTGYIDKTLLDKYLKELAGPIYYIAGPRAMVAGLRAMLNQASIDDDDIRTEEFSGY